MSFLTPLYFAALGALLVPVVLHLIRKQPKEDMPFSTLMFLSPSAPRVSKKSRIDNWLLLLMRAAVLGLFALAFTRPFVRASNQSSVTTPDRFRIVLIDRSASMLRDGYWQQAIEQARAAVNDLEAKDNAVLIAFDNRQDVLVAAAEPSMGDEAASRERALTQLAELEASGPTWFATNLVDALQVAAEQFEAFAAEQNDALPQINEVVLVSDLQAPADLDRLNTIRWPDRLRLIVRHVKSPKSSGNARVTLLESVAKTSNEDDATAAGQAKKLRVRIDNEAVDGAATKFSLAWLPEGLSATDSLGLLPQGEELVPGEYEVAPGQSRVLQLAPPGFESGSIFLRGDQTNIDNQFYFHRAKPTQSRFLYLTDREREMGADDIGYFVTKIEDADNAALPRVDVVDSDALAEEVQRDWPALVVTNVDLRAASAAPLQEYVRQGGVVAVVLDALPSQPEELNTWWQESFAEEQIVVTEAEVDDFLLLQNIDYSNRLFKPFIDPQVNNFAKIHFWHSRNIAGYEEGAWQVLARFDSGMPAVLERALDRGSYLVFAAGWQPQDSQLSVSTKFVPMMLNAASRKGQATDALRWTIGDRIDLSVLDGSTTVLTPLGEELRVDATDALEVSVPGIYRWKLEDGTIRYAAANVDRNEWLFKSLSTDQLERYGLRLGELANANVLQETARELQDREYESSQQWWRWLVIGCLGMIVLETAASVRRAPQLREEPNNG